MLKRQSAAHWAAGGAAIVALMLAACQPAPATPAKPTEAPKPAAPAASPAASPGASPAASPSPAAAAGPQPAAKVLQSGVATTKAPANKRDLVVATAADVTDFDPHMSTAINNITISFQIFDNLTTRDPDLNLIPQLATEWKSTGDLTWEFKLRPNVKWHNGDPLTARDVKFSIERTYDPEAKTQVATVFTTIDKIDAPNDTTVVFTTKKPDPLLPARLGFYGGQIIPEKYFKEVGADQFNRKPVGSGVVKFVEWVKDDHLTLEANKDYWGGAPDFDRAIFKPIPEPAARVAALMAGEADIILKVPSDQVDRLNQSDKARAEGAFYAGLYVLAVNSKAPPLDNAKIKQALSFATDRDAIVKSLWRGQGIVPNGFVSKGDTVGYDPNRPPLAYNLDRAKQLLQEGGYKNEPIIIESTQGQLQNDRQMAEAIIEMWKKAGINAQMEIIEASVRAQKVTQKTFKGLWWSDPTSTLQDPDGMMYRLLGPGGSQDYWRDPEGWDKLGDQARFSLDQKLRDENYKKMQDIMMVNFPWVPIVQPIESYGVAKYLNWRPNPNQLFQLRKEVLTFSR
ncbi:MAG TPA: ABC transporter substrate-binding protein [Chloroflexota bacterium]|nr:ABC transporter substrate-binding protein [Chloroflexota bacterium]